VEKGREYIRDRALSVYREKGDQFIKTRESVLFSFNEITQLKQRQGFVRAEAPEMKTVAYTDSELTATCEINIKRFEYIPVYKYCGSSASLVGVLKKELKSGAKP
jgi:hypothetical protein